MPRVGLGLTLRTSPLVNWLLPRRLVVATAELRGRALWRRHADARESSRATMQAILGGTARAEEQEALARRHLIEAEIMKALYWQPDQVAESDAQSQANLQAALATDRGLLISVCHLGPYFVIGTPLTSRGRRFFSVAGPWFFDPPTPNLWGRRLAHWRRRIAARRIEHLIPASKSFPVIQALLEEGETVLSFFDMPGPQETQYLGKPVMLANGTARLALSTGALVLPMRARRAGHRVWVDIAPAIDAREFTDIEPLHERLAAVHDRFTLELAETLEDPRRTGAWEQGATAQAWISARHAHERR